MPNEQPRRAYRFRPWTRNEEDGARRLLERRTRDALAAWAQRSSPEVFVTATFAGEMGVQRGLALTHRWLDGVARRFGHVRYFLGWGQQNRGSFHSHLLLASERSSMLRAAPFATVERGIVSRETLAEFVATPAWRALRHGAHDILVEPYDYERAAAAYVAAHEVELPSVACPRRSPCTRRHCTRLNNAQ